MFDAEQLPAIRELVRQRTAEDRRLLDEVLADVNQLRAGVVTIQPRNANSVSLVASDGGNNRVRFNPYYLQLVRVVDSNGAERFLDVVSPTTDTTALGARHLAERTPLGRLMGDLGAATLADLTPMIPPHPTSQGWTLVYRDICEWAVLYELICYREWGSDTLVIRDGLLRTKVFARDLFVQMYRLMKTAIERLRTRHRVDLYLVGIAKHSEILDRYRLAMSIADVLRAGEPRYVPIPIGLQQKVYRWAEYVRSPEEDRMDVEAPKFNMGSMYFVRFGPRSGDPVWTVDLLANQTEQAQTVLGCLVGDAEMGFPVPYYPQCLQQADAFAQVVDLDLAILQDTMVEAVRTQIQADRRHVFDAIQLADADPAARRYV